MPGTFIGGLFATVLFTLISASGLITMLKLSPLFERLSPDAEPISPEPDIDSIGN